MSETGFESRLCFLTQLLSLWTAGRPGEDGVSGCAGREKEV